MKKKLANNTLMLRFYSNKIITFYIVNIFFGLDICKRKKFKESIKM